MSNIAIENGPVEIVDFPIDSMLIFHSKLLVYQRVYTMSLEAMCKIPMTGNQWKRMAKYPAW